MAKKFNSVLNYLLENLQRVTDNHVLECILLDDLEYEKAQLVNEDIFYDSQKTTIITKKNHTSVLYLYWLYPDSSINHPLMRLMFLDTKNGPFLVFDIYNENVLNQLVSIFKSNEELLNVDGKQVFKHKITGNLIKFKYYKSINFSAAIISSHMQVLEDYNYSESMVVCYFSKRWN